MENTSNTVLLRTIEYLQASLDAADERHSEQERELTTLFQANLNLVQVIDRANNHAERLNEGAWYLRSAIATLERLFAGMRRMHPELWDYQADITQLFQVAHTGFRIMEGEAVIDLTADSDEGEL